MIPYYATVTPVTIIESGDVGHIVCYQYGKPYVDSLSLSPNNVSWEYETGHYDGGKSVSASAVVKQAQRNSIETLAGKTITYTWALNSGSNFSLSGTTGTSVTVTPKDTTTVTDGKTDTLTCTATCGDYTSASATCAISQVVKEASGPDREAIKGRITVSWALGGGEQHNQTEVVDAQATIAGSIYDHTNGNRDSWLGYSDDSVEVTGRGEYKIEFWISGPDGVTANLSVNKSKCNYSGNLALYNYNSGSRIITITPEDDNFSFILIIQN